MVQAGAIGGTGEVMVLEMGEPVRILDVARRMIELSGALRHRDRLHRAANRREAAARPSSARTRNPTATAHPMVRSVRVPAARPDPAGGHRASAGGNLARRRRIRPPQPTDRKTTVTLSDYVEPSSEGGGSSSSPSWWPCSSPVRVLRRTTPTARRPSCSWRVGDGRDPGRALPAQPDRHAARGVLRRPSSPGTSWRPASPRSSASPSRRDVTVEVVPADRGHGRSPRRPRRRAGGRRRERVCQGRPRRDRRARDRDGGAAPGAGDRHRRGRGPAAAPARLQRRGSGPRVPPASSDWASASPSSSSARRCVASASGPRRRSAGPAPRLMTSANTTAWESPTRPTSTPRRRGRRQQGPGTWRSCATGRARQRVHRRPWRLHRLRRRRG